MLATHGKKEGLFALLVAEHVGSGEKVFEHK